MKKTAIICLLAVLILTISGCSSGEKSISGIEQPKISTNDEIYPAQNATAAEKSDNVNGMRFSINLNAFTDKYNEIMSSTGSKDLLIKQNWKKTGKTNKDSNGVSYDYYYYDADKLNFTATVETQSGKLMNIGCATTTDLFVSQQKNQKFSDVVLQKSAVMAAAVCGFPSSSIEVLKNIFYCTTLENTDSLWYEGNVFSLSMNENKEDSQKSTMLFRVFPVKDSLKKEWDIPDYNTYIATAPTDSTTATTATKNNIITEK